MCNTDRLRQLFVSRPSGSSAWVNTLAFYLMVFWGFYLAGVIIGSLLPGDSVPEVFAENDKLTHFTSYLFLGWIPSISLSRLKHALPLGLITIPLGLVLEMGQAFVPQRSPEFGDFLANTAGVLIGVGLGLAIRRALKLR